ncbi:MAG: LL-diaminopimelate aminotransferase [Proteobacteria bacterium]|nr:LL-diaminopimelate aminotransferase [Pseudomonadota bacterium]
MPKPSVNLGKLPPYLFAELDRKIDAAKEKGVDIINLGIGDPDLPTPAPVVKALQEAAADPATHNYSPYSFTIDYRKAAAAWMKSRFGVEADPATEILGLIGSKEGIAHIILAYVDPGDVVLCPSPGYPVYANYALLCGGTVHAMPLKAGNGFLPDFGAIPEETARRAKIMFLNYPNNPTGALADEKFIREALAYCRKYDILLCHDNAYSEMTFDGYRAPSFLSEADAKDICIEFFSLSKMYNMTGWRVGFAVGNAAALKALGLVKSNTDSGAFKAIQRAAAVALSKSDELTAGLNKIYAQRRDIVVAGLQNLGWDFTAGVATFYLWIPVPPGMDSAGFCEALFEKCGIVTAPGLGYGPAGEGFFRIALTVPEARLKEALSRMEKAGIRYGMKKAA